MNEFHAFVLTRRVAACEVTNPPIIHDGQSIRGQSYAPSTVEPTMTS